MYLHYRDLKLIQISGRPDEDNEAILRGDYLDKAPTYTEDGQEIPFLMPSRDEMIKQFIFTDWQQGDILIIADQPLKHPKLQGDTLVEMTREEVCESGDLSVLTEGEVYQDGVIIKKEKPQGVKTEWQYPNWVETATQDEIDLDAINKMYDEYKTMDFPSVVKEMELQDPAMSEEFLNMLIQLRGMASQITLGIRTMSILPQPSKELIAFKNRFNQNK